MTLRSCLILVALGCGGSPARSVTLPTEPPAAQTILNELDHWCAGVNGDCDVAEHPDGHPGQVAAGETNGWISSHRDQLHALGVEAVWDVGLQRFRTQVESDLSYIVSGMFSADHLGPAQFDAISARAKARPAVYLGVLVAMVDGPNPDPAQLSSQSPETAIELVRSNAPTDAKVAAAKLLPLVEAALAKSTPPPANDAYRADRLSARVAALQRLAR